MGEDQGLAFRVADRLDLDVAHTGHIGLALDAAGGIFRAALVHDADVVVATRWHANVLCRADILGAVEEVHLRGNALEVLDLRRLWSGGHLDPAAAWSALASQVFGAPVSFPPVYSSGYSPKFHTFPSRS